MSNFFSLCFNSDNFIFINLDNIETIYYKEYCVDPSSEEPSMVNVEIVWLSGKAIWYSVPHNSLERLIKEIENNVKGDPTP